MVFQNIEADYKNIGYPEIIIKALDYLKATDFLSMPAGVYEIEGKDLYAQVFDYVSKERDECKPEFHKNYLDIQFWVNGKEKVGFAPMVKKPVVIEENLDRDLYFTSAPDKENFIEVGKGDYVILYPNDIHRPGVLVDKPEEYRKVVLKVKATRL